jgi:hypothetical protein
VVEKMVDTGGREREDATFVFQVGAVAGEGAKLVRGTVEGRHQSASSRGGEDDPRWTDGDAGASGQKENQMGKEA